MQDHSDTGNAQLKKVISGGQTGVDRAALDAAMALGIDIGGWCPRGRKAADGVIPAQYPLTETRGKSYQTRTKWNVRDSDATLIICRGEPAGGTALTMKYCEQLGKPFEVFQLNSAGTTEAVGKMQGTGGLDSLLHWLTRHHVQVLNVAGPREEKHCPIYAQAYALLFGLIQQIQNQGESSCVKK